VIHFSELLAVYALGLATPPIIKLIRGFVTDFIWQWKQLGKQEKFRDAIHKEVERRKTKEWS
jgi:hypothetical protein